jgi:hypothetical protein
MGHRTAQYRAAREAIDLINADWPHPGKRGVGQDEVNDGIALTARAEGGGPSSSEPGWCAPQLAELAWVDGS